MGPGRTDKARLSLERASAIRRTACCPPAIICCGRSQRGGWRRRRARGPARLARARDAADRAAAGMRRRKSKSRGGPSATSGLLLGKLGGLRQVVPPHAREFRDEVFLGVNIAGMAVASQGGRELTPRAGDAVLFSSPEAGFTSSRPRPSQFLGLRLPHRIACAARPESRPGFDAADTQSNPFFAIAGRLSLLARLETGPKIGSISIMRSQRIFSTSSL